MELITQKIRQCIEKVKDMSQVGFDRDYVIKDNKPDVSKVICQNGQVKLDEIKASGENIWLSGSIEFEVLYTREEVFEGDEPEENIGGNRVEHIKDAIPFQEKLVLQGVCEKDTVRVYTGLDELTVGVINSRKLSVRGIISVELYGEREENLEVAQRIDDKDVEQLMGQMKVLKLDSVVRDIVRIKNVVTLPKTKPNICKLISSLVDMRNLEYTYERDHITLTGECHACIVYLSEEQEICCFEVQEGFSNEIRCEGDNAGNIAWLRTQPAMHQVEAENDYDGELRQLSIEAALAVDGKVWSEETVEVLNDMYSVSCPVKPVFENVKVCSLLMKNDTKCRILEQLYRENSKKRILRICGTKTQAAIAQIKNADTGIIVSGVLQVNCVNIVEDDGCPIEMHTDSVPFEQFVEIPGMDANTCCEVNVQVDQVQVNLLDNSEYEIKGVVSINAIALQQDEVSVITSVEQEKTASDTEEEAALVGYIVQKDAEKKKSQAEQDLKDKKNEINGLKDQQQITADDIKNKSAKLDEILAAQKKLQTDITSKQAEIEQNQKDLAAAQEKQQEQYDAMKKRIQFMYENSAEDNIWTAIIESNGITDMLNRIEYVSDVYDSDRALMDSYQAAVEQVKEIGTKLDNDMNELTAMQDDYEKQQADVEAAIVALENQKEQYASQIAQAQQQAENYQNIITAQGKIIQLFVIKIKRAGKYNKYTYRLLTILYKTSYSKYCMTLYVSVCCDSCLCGLCLHYNTTTCIYSYMSRIYHYVSRLYIIEGYGLSHRLKCL